MSEGRSFVIDQSLPSERFDVFLRRKFPELSRAAIQRLLAEGNIRVDGKQIKPTHRPRAGETVTMILPAPEPSAALPEDLPLDILYEDEDIIVLNKPAGMVVHPAAGHGEHTLVNALLHHCRGQLSGVGGVARPGIVHRLDKDTSGCLVAAKNDAAHLQLSAAFAQRDAVKIYQAVVCGRMARLSGKIEAAIARHPIQRKKMAVAMAPRPSAGESIPARLRGARDARTGFQAVARTNDTSWLEVVLHTGRTHQIRVHLAHLGNPVVGDMVYGRRANVRLKELTGYAAERQLLHAWRLELNHPRTGARLRFEAPLPEDFTLALDFLRLRREN